MKLSPSLMPSLENTHEAFLSALRHKYRSEAYLLCFMCEKYYKDKLHFTDTSLI